MFKCFRNVICLAVVSWISFVLLAAWSGGGKIRELGDKAEGLIQEGVYKLADKADSVQASVSGLTSIVKKWTGKQEDDTGKSPGQAPGQAKETKKERSRKQ